MSFTKNPALVPDRDSLPLKKREQSSKQQQQCDAAHFKAPYPYKSQGEFRTKHTGPFRPVPRRVTALYQPWMQTHTPARPKQHIPSAFREHHGWPEWREFVALPPEWDFSHYFPHLQGHLSGTWPLHPGLPHYTSRFSPVSLVAEPKILRDKSVNPERQTYAKHQGPCVRRGDRKSETLPRVEKASPPLMSTCLPPSPHEDITLQRDESTKAVAVSRGSLISVSPDDPHGSFTSVTENTSRSPAAATANRFPWLLPHFMAGSLIELRDGRLRRVEHLQTEDFLLGSLACPDLHLSCCTVQSISPSASSSSVSRLLILLHDQQSQVKVTLCYHYYNYYYYHHYSQWPSRK